MVRTKTLLIAICITLCIGIGLGIAGGLELGHRWWYSPTENALVRDLVVDEATDGDTLSTRFGDVKLKVRLMGMDTPETVDRRKSAQCFGMEAKLEMKKIEGKTLRFEFIPPDPPAVKRDTFGRALAYVFLPDGTMLNMKMLREGFAHQYTYRGAYKYRSEFKRAEEEAKTARRGMWANAACAAESSRGQ